MPNFEQQVSSLFRKLICESTILPTYPEEKIRDLYIKLEKHSSVNEIKKNLIAIHHRYFDELPDGGPLRGIDSPARGP